MNYSLEEEIVESFFIKIKSLILPSEENNFKSKFLQSDLLLYFVVLVLAIRIVTSLSSINIPKNIFFADITKSFLETSLNQTRQSAGLQPLAENQKLDQVAQMKAQNMVQDNYFNHTSPSGVTPWFWFLQAGYKYKYAGENLAIGFYDSEEVYQAWLNSPEHKANIVNPNYTEVGTAVLGGFGGGNTIVVVQEFGSQLPVKTVASKNNNTKQVVIQSKPTPVATTEKVKNAPEVLSQSTESNISIKPQTTYAVNNLPAKVANSFLYNYNEWLQDAIFGLSMVVIGILITLVLFNFKITFRKQLVFRAALLIILLSVATLASKETIISFIPHQILI